MIQFSLKLIMSSCNSACVSLTVFPLYNLLVRGRIWTQIEYIYKG